MTSPWLGLDSVTHTKRYFKVILHEKKKNDMNISVILNGSLIHGLTCKHGFECVNINRTKASVSKML